MDESCIENQSKLQLLHNFRSYNECLSISCHSCSALQVGTWYLGCTLQD